MYTAIIIEPRQHLALSFVLQTFANVLPVEWNFILFHGNNNLTFINDILDTSLVQHKTRFTLISLKVDNLTTKEYNTLLMTKEFYNHIPTETFLLFQTDTILIEKHNYLLDFFLEYDYVGAPWDHKVREKNNDIGNGGLSLRKKTKMLEIIDKEDPNHTDPEDVFFSCPYHVSIHKPPFEKAKLFSVEEIFSPISFGCHQPWNRSYGNQLYDLYDEVKLLSKYHLT
jgi:hypothetical protein